MTGKPGELTSSTHSNDTAQYPLAKHLSTEEMDPSGGSFPNTQRWSFGLTENANIREILASPTSY